VPGLAAVDADGDEIEERKEGAFGGRGEEHGVGGHGCEEAELFGGFGERAEMGIEKGFAAGEADDIVAEGRGLVEEM